MAVLRHRRNRSAMHVEPEFNVGSKVQFLTETSAGWIDAVVESITAAGDMQLSFWISPADQARLLRPNVSNTIDEGPWIEPKNDFIAESVVAPAEFTTSQVSATEEHLADSLPDEKVESCDTDASFFSSADTTVPDVACSEDRLEAAEAREATKALDEELENLRLLLETEQAKFSKLRRANHATRKNLAAARLELDRKADIEERLRSAEAETAHLTQIFEQAARLWPNVRTLRTASAVTR